MSQRTIRVNELIRREISDFIHTKYRSEAVAITITKVRVSPDLRQGRVYYSVLGQEETKIEAGRFLARHKGEIRRQVGTHVILKNLPHFEYFYDDSMERGAATLAAIEAIEAELRQGEESEGEPESSEP
jgi:ribosome-binding factor A